MAVNDELFHYINIASLEKALAYVETHSADECFAQREDDGKTPLHCLVRNIVSRDDFNMRPLLEKLLEIGTPEQCFLQTKSGRTALDIAYGGVETSFAERDYNIFELLVKKAPSIDIIRPYARGG